MAFAIFYDTPIFDGRDAVCGTRTRRFNANTYETSALPLCIVARETGAEDFPDDVAVNVVDLVTGRKLFDEKRFGRPHDEEIF